MRNGFTIIELAVVVGLFGLLVGIGTLVGFDAYRGYAFRTEQGIIVSLLRKARNQAFTNTNESSHGLYLGADEYVLFEGDSYDARVPERDEVVPANREFSRSGLSEVVFESLSGTAAPEGAITIAASESRSATISINHEGRIDW